MDSSPTVAYLQQLFREALNEDEDFASSVFAKRKLESALTYESLIRGVSCGEGEELNSFGNEGEKQAVGEGSSNSTSPQPRNFSPDEQNSMLEMLKNETMFGVISSSPATGATKLIITIIRKLLTSNQFHRDVQRSSVVGVDDDDDESSTPTSATASTKMTQKGRACSAPPMALGLVDVVVAHWLGAEDVGVGSAAANAITDALILLAAEASSYIPSSSSTSAAQNSTAAQNQNPFLVAMNAIASRTESGLNTVCQGTTHNGTALYRREAEMRLLDALTRAYNEEVNREIELGTMVGLPMQSKGDFSSSRVGGGGEPPITPPSVSPLSLVVSTLASETSVLARLFNDTASGMIALIGKGSRNDAEITLLRGEILATMSGGIGSNKEGSTRESVVGGGGDQSNDPLMLINTMSTACALGRFVPIALADTTEGNRTNNDSSAIGALSSPSAVNKETREAIRFFSAAARCFLRRAFTTIPPPVHAEANGANRASLAFVPLLSIPPPVEGGEDMEKEVDPYLSVITPFILRGLATFLRNNSAGLALLLNVTQMKNGQGTLELPSAATILASAAASFSPAQPEKEGPILAISAETIEVAEAFIDFMAAVITQKPNVVSEVRTALAFLESKELRLTKSHENRERTLALASDRLDSELDTLCSIFVAIPTKQAVAASPHPIFMSNLLLSQLLYPSKPVPADLKTSALLCVAAVVSSPLFARAHHNKCFKDKNEVAEGDDDNTSIADQGPTQQQQQQPAENASMKALKDAFSLKTFNDSVYSHKSSLDESVRRACWHALVAFLQHPLLRVPTAPSIGAHLTGLVTADFAESSLEVRRSQLLCCDLLLKMPEAAPFHEKLKAERRSGIYSKPQPGMTSGASVGTEYAY